MAHEVQTIANHGLRLLDSEQIETISDAALLPTVQQYRRIISRGSRDNEIDNALPPPRSSFAIILEEGDRIPRMPEYYEEEEGEPPGYICKLSIWIH